MNKGIRAILTGAAIGVVLILFAIWTASVQSEIGKQSKAPTEAAATPSPEPDLSIIFIDEVPTAVAIPTATETPTPTPEPTPTPTVTPVPTATPTEMVPERARMDEKPTNTPKPTNPPPTPKPTQIAQNKVEYTEGTPGTRKAEVNGTHAWKPWARHTAVTKKKSPQYRLEQIAKTDEKGIRIVKDPNGEWRYLVALPVYWAGGLDSDIGRLVDIQMVNGAVLKCVLADNKQIEHSLNGEGKYGSRGEIIEVICEEAKLAPSVRGGSDASRLGKEWEGEVESITAYDKFIEGFEGR